MIKLMPKILVCSVRGSGAKILMLHQRVSVLLVFLFLASLGANAEYAVPAGRRINWYPAGLDVVGGIRTAFAVTNAIAGLHPDGSVNDATTINNAISAASSNTVLTIGAGTFLIASDINMKNGVVLRGVKPHVAPFLPAADASQTTLIMNGTKVYFAGGDKSSSWTPGIQSGTSITAGYTQGSTSLTLSSATSYAIGDYIAVYQNKDTAWIDDKGYSWLGEDSGPDPHVWAQYTRITGKSGDVLTIDPPLYQVTPSPT